MTIDLHKFIPLARKWLEVNGKRTPGLWRVWERPRGLPIISLLADDGRVADCYLKPQGHDLPNANFIALQTDPQLADLMAAIAALDGEG